jgi:hypothetical protein
MPTKISTSTPNTPRPGAIAVTVADAGGAQAPVGNALVAIYDAAAAQASPGFKGKNWEPGSLQAVASGRTDDAGQILFDGLAPGDYTVYYGHYPVTQPKTVTVDAGCTEPVCFHVALDAGLTTAFKGPNCEPLPCERPRQDDQLFGSVDFNNNRDPQTLQQIAIVFPQGARRNASDPVAFSLPLRHTGTNKVQAALELGLRGGGTGAAAVMRFGEDVEVDEKVSSPVSGAIQVSMTRSETEPTADLKLWGAIKLSTEAMGFDQFDAFMEMLFCGADGGVRTRDAEKARFDQLLKRRFLPFNDTDAYRLMKAATEAFVMVNCGIIPTDLEFDNAPSILAAFRAYLDRRDLPRPGAARYLERQDGVLMLPYLAIIRRKLPDVPIASLPRNSDSSDIDACDALIQQKLRNPCLLELIWSYWHEEAMQVQTLNAISRRFQNVRGALDPDPLANVEVNPLRPLNNLLWGYIQDEQHRLTVARRNAEYDHHYGIRLEGRAVQGFRGADTRSKFIEAFHHLLRLCTEFYKQDDDTTVKADAFGVLNALKEVHLILSQGAHSQFGDMPVTARIEMLMQQWLLARPEFREFLPTRVMVAYPEPWMDRVDAMKKLQGWTDTSVIHFHNLAVFGEQVLLAIRYGAWSTVFEPTQAFNFARFWRPQIQGYIHAYRAATGVELGAAAVTQQVDATLPSLLLQRRLSAQRRSA